MTLKSMLQWKREQLIMERDSFAALRHELEAVLGDFFPDLREAALEPVPVRTRTTRSSRRR
jgi:hypothetical protein